MAVAKERLSTSFPGIHFTDVITTAAYGKPDDAPPYSNMLAECDTKLKLEDLVTFLKKTEKDMGDKVSLRAEGIVLMDIDLLEYNRRRYHLDDWNRPYIKKLLAMLPKLMLVILLLFATNTVVFPQRSAANRQDTELLGKAMGYYQGGKYHECILAFEKLKRNYKLTPRFLAHLGFSYYKEQRYNEAVDNLQQAIPLLSAYSPKERTVYIYSCAESLFFLHRYKEALKYYSMALPLAEGNDKGDILFHTAFAHYLQNVPADVDYTQKADLDTVVLENIISLFSEAQTLYRANIATATSLQSARLRQCETMLKGLRRKER